jgi:hypothetical protein
VKFKLEIVWYAHEHGNRAVGRKFDVEEINLRLWLSEIENLEGISKWKFALCCKSVPIHMWRPNYMNIL